MKQTLALRMRKHVKPYVHVVGGCVIAMCVAVTAAQAQLTLPDPGYGVLAPAIHSLVPTAIAVDVAGYDSTLRTVLTTARKPDTDSVRAAVQQRAIAWQRALRVGAVVGMDLEAVGQLAVAAGADSEACALFTQRLSVPRLSVLERAYTLHLAALAFTDPSRPTHLAIAEGYVAQLDTFPLATAGLWVSMAHQAIAMAYEAAGDSTHALAHEHRVLAIVPQLPYRDRGFFYYGGAKIYLALAHHLAATAAGQAVLANVTTTLLSAAHPSAAQVAADSGILRLEGSWKQKIVSTTALANTLGHATAAIQAMQWWNFPGHIGLETTRRTLRLDDGIPRVILFGDLPDVIGLLHSLDRIQARLPYRIQTLVVAEIRGEWGVRVVSPEEEVRSAKAFADSNHVSTPVALWKGQRRRTADGGILPEPSPNDAAFHTGRGDAIIVDGQGIVRRVFHGFGRDDETLAIAALMAIVNTTR